MPALLCPHRWILANPSCPRPRIPGVRPWRRLEEQTHERGPAASRQRPGLPLTQTGEATRPSAGARSPGRRGFLLGVGGLAAAALIGPGGGWSGSEQMTSGSASSRQPGGSGLGLDVEARRTRALELRLTTAHQQLADPFPQPAANGDEARYDELLGWPTSPKPCPTTPWARSTRAPTGRCCGPCAAAARPTSERIPLGGRAKLANPEGAFSFELQGPDPWQRPLPPPPRIDSEAFAGEMTECYWLALARDIPYARYGQEPVTAAAITDLRRFAVATTTAWTPAPCSAAPTPGCPG